jgi:hypothetical protein
MITVASHDLISLCPCLAVLCIGTAEKLLDEAKQTPTDTKAAALSASLMMKEIEKVLSGKYYMTQFSSHHLFQMTSWFMPYFSILGTGIVPPPYSMSLNQKTFCDAKSS